MALNDRPWWDIKDTIWGGETFTADDDEGDKPKIGIKNGDKFRVEKKGLSRTLSLHTHNQGTLRNAQGNWNALKLDEAESEHYLRAYSMSASVELVNQETGQLQRVPLTLYLVERANGSVALTSVLNPVGGDDSTANVER